MAQSIQNKSILSMTREALRSFVDNADKHLLKKRFKLGVGYCEFTQRDNEITYDIIETNNCEVTQIISDNIEGKTSRYIPENPHTENIKEYIPPKETLYQLWLSKGNKGSIEDFLYLLLLDNKADWAEANW